MKCVKYLWATVLAVAVLLALEGRGAGPPPAAPSTLVIAPTLVGSVRGGFITGFMAFSPDGRTLAANHGEMARFDRSGTMLLWEAASLRLRRRGLVPSEDLIYWWKFDFTPDGRKLLARTEENPLLWDLVGRKVEMRFPRPDGARSMPGVAMSPTGRTLAVLPSGRLPCAARRARLAQNSPSRGRHPAAPAACARCSNTLRSTRRLAVAGKLARLRCSALATARARGTPDAANPLAQTGSLRRRAAGRARVCGADQRSAWGGARSAHRPSDLPHLVRAQ